FSHDGRLIGLVYGDAQQFLGVPITTSLEHAFLGAVCHDTPSAASVALVFGQLYERIGHLLYPQSFTDDPAAADFVFRLRHLDESLRLWQAAGRSAARARQDVNTWVATGRGQFRDPVDYFLFLKEFVPWVCGEDGSHGPAPTQAAEGEAAAAAAAARQRAP